MIVVVMAVVSVVESSFSHSHHGMVLHRTVSLYMEHLYIEMCLKKGNTNIPYTGVGTCRSRPNNRYPTPRFRNNHL